jgi:DNA-binding response OmpR family regulator
MAKDILQGARLVLLEDDEFLAEVIVRKLTSVGADIKRYRNGLEGLAAIRQYTPDLVLLDIMMPIMNGYEVLQVMSEEHLIEEVPVMVVSNSGQPVEIDKVMKLGVRDYVVKVDFTPDEVLEKARAILISIKKAKGESIDEYNPATPTPPSAATMTPPSAVAPVSAPAAATSAVPIQSAPSAQPAGGATLEALKVLVVEDDPLLKNLLAVKLTASGCLPLYVDDGLKAYDLAITFKPDVVLLDLMIPGMDGFGVLEKFQGDPVLRDVPVFVFSNKSSEQDKQRVFSLGAKLFKQKAETNLSEVVTELYKLAGRQRA